MLVIKMTNHTCAKHGDYRDVCLAAALVGWIERDPVSIWNTHTHTHLTALCPGLPGWAWAGTRKVKPIWILLKQETVSGSGISWDICKSAPCSRPMTMPVPHHSVFYRPDALPAAQPTASKHWRHKSLSEIWLLNWCICQCLLACVQCSFQLARA